MLVEEIDGFRKGEDGDIPSENDGNSGDDDKDWSHIIGNGFRYRCAGEEGHAKINKDEILRKLGKCRENIFCRSLSSP